MEENDGRCPVNWIQLLPLGSLPRDILDDLCGALAKAFGRRSEILPPELVPAHAFNVSRGQYSSTEILAVMASRIPTNAWRLLAITPSDLYVPVLTFVFGEAQVKGLCAIVSTYRLRQEFYGLPPNATLLRERLLKEAVHELGHTLGLLHCEDHQCVMAASHAIEWIDLKGSDFCHACREKAVMQLT